MQKLLTVSRRSGPPSSCVMIRVLADANVACVVLIANETLPPLDNVSAHPHRRYAQKVSGLFPAVVVNVSCAPDINASRAAGSKDLSSIGRASGDLKCAAKIAPCSAGQNPEFYITARFYNTVRDFRDGAVAAAGNDQTSSFFRSCCREPVTIARLFCENAVERSEMRSKIRRLGRPRAAGGLSGGGGVDDDKCWERHCYFRRGRTPRLPLCRFGVSVESSAS